MGFDLDALVGRTIERVVIKSDPNCAGSTEEIFMLFTDGLAIKIVPVSSGKEVMVCELPISKKAEIFIEPNEQV